MRPLGLKTLPVAGSDGYCYLCIWHDARGWISDRDLALASDAPLIIQRAMSGRHRGQEWTIRQVSS